MTLTSANSSTLTTHRIPGAWPSPPLRPQNSTVDAQQPGTRASLPAGSQSMCHICRDDFPLAEVVALTCRHHCCRGCLNEIYRGATVDESRYPPRCCADHPLTHQQSRHLLDVQVVREFLDKTVEWDTRNRTYCSNGDCGVFIRPENIRGKDARCTRCRTKTCAGCKKAAHDRNTSCANDEERQEALRLMDRKGWWICGGCGNG